MHLSKHSGQLNKQGLKKDPILFNSNLSVGRAKRPDLCVGRIIIHYTYTRHTHTHSQKVGIQYSAGSVKQNNKSSY